MSYLLLIVEPVGQRAQRTPEEGRDAYAQMVRYAEGLKARGLLTQAESLKSGPKACGCRSATVNARWWTGRTPRPRK